MSAMKSLTNTDGIILVLYGDVPLVSAETMRNLCEKIGDNYALAVLGFSPRDTRAYGRLITNQNGELEQIVEHAEASDAQRAVGFCNSGILAGRAEDMRRLMPKIRNDNSKGEYYLTDIVALARAEGLQVATSEADEMEVTGVNSKPELLALELLYLDTLKKRA